MTVNNTISVEERRVLYTSLMKDYMNSPISYTDDLARDGAKFTVMDGATSVKYYIPESAGLLDYDADNVNANKGKQPKGRFATATLDHDRYFRFTVDETMAGTVVGDIVDQHLEVELEEAVFEQDAIRISTAASGAGVKDGEEITEENVREKIFEAIAHVKDASRLRVNRHARGLVMYINTKIYNMIKHDKRVVNTRNVLSADGSENYNITEIDGVKVVPVPSEFMQTKFEKEDGVGRLVPAEDSKEVNFVVLPTRAMAVPTILNKVKVFEPGTESNPYHWTVTGRFAYGAFVVEGDKFQGAMFASIPGEEIKAKAAPKTAAKK